jgi:hypothetical protein
MSDAVQQVVQALNVLYQDPDPTAKEKANAWLSEFQKSVSGLLIPALGGGSGRAVGERRRRKLVQARAANVAFGRAAQELAEGPLRC